MALPDFRDHLFTYEAPTIPFSTRPELMIPRGYKMPVYKYIEPEIYLPQFRFVTTLIAIPRYKAIGYNANGGEFPKELFEHFAHYKGKIFSVEYHNTGEVKKRIPKEFRDEEVLMLEDIYDTGVTKYMMEQDCKNIDTIVSSLKIDVPNQIPPHRVYPLFKTVNKWQGGGGMDLGEKNDPFYPPNALRKYPGIVIRPPNEVLQQFKEKQIVLV